MRNAVQCLTLFAVFGANAALADIIIGSVTVNDTDLHYLKYGRFMRVPFAIQEETDPTKPHYVTWHSGDNPDSKTPQEIAAVAAAIRTLEEPPATDRQYEIYTRMKNGVTINGSVIKENFTFDSETHAMKSVKQRIETINKFIEFSADPSNTPFTYVKRDGKGKFPSHWDKGLEKISFCCTKYLALRTKQLINYALQITELTANV